MPSHKDKLIARIKIKPMDPFQMKAKLEKNIPNLGKN
jgi:hypothetical protein